MKFSIKDLLSKCDQVGSNYFRIEAPSQIFD